MRNKECHAVTADWSLIFISARRSCTVGLRVNCTAPDERKFNSA